MMMPLVGAGLLLCLFGGSEPGPPWFSTTTKLTRIGTGLAGEGFYLTIDVPTTVPCHSKQFLFMELDNPQYRETQAIALLAFAQARPIDVHYDGSCWSDAVKLFAVSIRTNP